MFALGTRVNRLSGKKPAKYNTKPAGDIKYWDKKW